MRQAESTTRVLEGSGIVCSGRKSQQKALRGPGPAEPEVTIEAAPLTGPLTFLSPRQQNIHLLQDRQKERATVAQLWRRYFSPKACNRRLTVKTSFEVDIGWTVSDF